MNDPNLSIETKLAVMENRLADNTDSLRVVNSSIEKLTEISGSLKEIIAVHENRLEQRERTDIHIFELIEKRTEQFDRGIKKATEKAEELNKQVQQLLRESLENQSREIKEMFNKIDERFNTLEEEKEKEQTDLEKRVVALERWRWIMIGAGITIGLVVGQIGGHIGTIISQILTM